MLAALRALTRFLDERIGWHRIGIALSIAILVIAGVALYRVLRGLALNEVMTALRATPVRSVVLSGLCVAAAYATLTFYDLFALRTIGKGHVPYRIAALAGFTSYSVGHNVGVTALTGGAVRYRIYSIWGLTVMDVAKICFVAGLTFWLGNATVLGLGIAVEPGAASAIDQLPPWLNRILAAAMLAMLAAYVAWVWNKPRVIGKDNWEVTLPGGPLTLLQIVIGIADLGFCTLAMYLLLPAQPHTAFVPIAVIFVSATLLGFASAAPGGIGVFDVAMLVALLREQFMREDVVAGLLLFRVLYYVVPFVIALTILGIRELLLDVKELTHPEMVPPPGGETHEGG
jgi:uncharacterized membrane protein YbhN (UPF0104 family)